MEINKTNAFLIVLLNYAFLLPILLIFGIELQKLITEITWDLLYLIALFDYVIPALLLAISFVLILYYQHFYYKRKIIKQNLKCVFCEERAIVELFKIPNFYIIFGLPICEQHLEALDETPSELLYNEQRLYNKHNKIVLRLNILLVASGLVSLWYFGTIFDLNGNVSLIALIYVLFTTQFGLHFYLSVRVFIKIRNGIEKSLV